MKVTIIVFSPGGNTLKVAEKIKQSAQAGDNIQLINITGNEAIFCKNQLQTYLEKNVEDHEVLLIGSPVYAHHIQYHVIDLIRHLPKPNKKWGKYAACFVTFGEVSSGIALNEANILLKRSGRKILSGLKITAEHSLTRLLEEPLNPGKPGDEIDGHIKDFWKNITKRFCNDFENDDVIRSMNYQPKKDRIKAHIIFREKLWQKFLYPKIQIIHKKCSMCGLCLKACPVNHLQIQSSKIIESKSSACITCGNCVVNCSKNAITMTGNIDKFAEMMEDFRYGRSKVASNEDPKNVCF